MSIPADGPEEVITAEEYLQPQTAAARHRRAVAGGNIPYHINGALELVGKLLLLLLFLLLLLLLFLWSIINVVMSSCY
jgi:hypothetical protein